MFDLSVDLMLVRYGQPVGVKALVTKPVVSKIVHHTTAMVFRRLCLSAVYDRPTVDGRWQ